MTNNVAADNHGHIASASGRSDGRLTIGLLGHSFSSGNLGIQALTVCNLAIARDVARGHGGDIVLQRSPLGGLRAVVRLPG